jgi:shikimate 5-dehydrogenase
MLVSQTRLQQHIWLGKTPSFAVLKVAAISKLAAGVAADSGQR